MTAASYDSSETIFALATPVGGAIAVVRLSGGDAKEMAARLGVPEGDRQILRRVGLSRCDGTPLDDAMVVFFQTPRSFTGEDVVEFHLHGSSATTTALMEELSALGARQALPGEFSYRALQNGKMDLNHAQALADLIRAENEGARVLALEKMSGTQTRLITKLADDLKSLCALAEVGIDFSDQDQDEVKEVTLAPLKEKIAPIADVLKKLSSSFNRGQKIQEGIRVAIVGRPNAGKSSLYNALLGEDRSIVSDTPGTTRDVIRETLSFTRDGKSATFRIEDTAGLRRSEEKVEAMGVERARKTVRGADLVLLVVDSSNFNAAEEKKLWAELDISPDLALGVFSKSDLAGASRECPVEEIADWVRTSSMTGEGLEELVHALLDRAGKWTARDSKEIVLTNQEQKKAVDKSLEHLGRAQAATEADLFAADVRQVLVALGPLIGETPTDEILHQIFSQFCIGK